MFPSSATTKRKIDFQKNEPTVDANCKDIKEEEEMPSCSTKRLRRQSEQNGTPYSSNVSEISQNVEDQRLDRVREIISREFSREIKSKEAQLDLVGERLEETKNLLERLRYAIVAEYYKKQEQAQTMIDAANALRAESTVLETRDHLQQVPLHPSLKKIIGKRPHNLADIMRACPKREAAKNAKHVLSTKSPAERREERRVQKVIKEKGLVIDHSNQNIKLEPGSSGLIKNQTIQTKPNERVDHVSNGLELSTPKVLNSMRTSNKLKYHFVVGNTSKYIGKVHDRSQANNNTSFSHKWLVYVQTKDTKVPIEKFVKKVRFFLHPSYRPNDVVDIHEPPFQVARRGWGEFPMRIQLFFHESFQQKSLQLLHNVVLDKTKSGLHTLGAETVVEVWLRNDAAIKDVRQFIKFEDESHHNLPISTKTPNSATPDNYRKPRTISLNIKETFDDNFFDFLNKIEESRTSICADIEKIEPTLLVNEPLEPQFSNNTRSPINKELLRSPFKTTSSHLSPFKNMSSHLTPHSFQTKDKHYPITNLPLPKSIKDAANKLSAAINQSEAASNDSSDIKEILAPKLVNESGPIASKNQSTVQAASSVPLFQQITSNDVPVGSDLTSSGSKTISINNVLTSASGKIFNNASGTVILPVTKKQFLPFQHQKHNLNVQVQPNLAKRAVFQKKTIQVVNAQGEVKTVQMLIASPQILSDSIAATPLTTTSATTGLRIITSKALGTSEPNSIPDNVEMSNTNHYTKRETTTSKCEIITPSPSAKKEASMSISSVSPQYSNRNSNYSTNTIKPLTSSPKHVVFQKEGKLYIIDPQQMRLKQQQKHQVSLLKPQVKHQTQQRSSTLQSVASDHDYAPPPSQLKRSFYMHSSQNDSLIRAPQLHLGMRETRLYAIKALDHQKWQRIQLERKFNITEFSNMRSAVEFLLRRLPLISNDKDSTAIAFPFVTGTLKEFNSLPAFKQRSFEWLRAKYISRILRNPKSLQALHASGEETFWSTREIATFARFYGYVPPIKALQQIETNHSDIEEASSSKEHFSALVKTEMRSEQLLLEYDSLSPASHIIHWIDNMQQRLEKVHQQFNTEELIIVDDDNNSPIGKKPSKEQSTSEITVTKRIYGSPLKFQVHQNNISYLPPPGPLETAFQYVGDVCKDISVRLRPEEIVPGIVHPSTQTVLAHISQLFIERLLRQSIANQSSNEQERHSFNSRLPHNNVERVITSQDIRKTISQSAEFDFLTNCYMGITSQQTKNE